MGVGYGYVPSHQSVTIDAFDKTVKDFSSKFGETQMDALIKEKHPELSLTLLVMADSDRKSYYRSCIYNTLNSALTA